MEIILENLNTALIGRSIRHYATLPSTMDMARTLAGQGAREGTVVLCDEQTAGRGRQGHGWIGGGRGNSVLISVILHPKVEELPQLNMMASLAVLLAIRKTAAIIGSVKWPNDVLIRGKKVAGILIENIFEGPRLRACIIGVGLNISLNIGAYSEISPLATSLSAETGRDLSRDDVLRTLLEEMDALYAVVQQGGDIYPNWLPHVVTVGKAVRIRSGQAIEEGIAQSVNRDGSITLRRADGSLVTIATGEPNSPA